MKDTDRSAYTAEDHATWAKLFARQKARNTKVSCREYLVGFKKLGLDPRHVPSISQTSRRLKKLSGWTLVKAKSSSVSIKDWFAAMGRRTFPVTDYIRKPKNFDYTPQPDLFHEYFGHLPYFTDKKFAAMAEEFGILCRHANPRQMLQISRLWSLGIEFGLVRERGRIKLFGAGLQSSYGESLHAETSIKKGKVIPFTLKEVTKTPGRTYEYHKRFFVLENVQEVRRALRSYAAKESLL